MDVVASGLGFDLGGRALVAGVSTRMPAGRLTALLGPNGAGKTTLLRLLCGELTPARGDVAYGGRPLAGFEPPELARTRAVLPQIARLAFGFTVARVVALGRLPHGESAARSEAIARSVLAELDLDRLAERSWLTLSGGERQRVQLARALCQLADVSSGALFLDEPTNHLDLHQQIAILERARDAARRGLAVVAVLHDLGLAAAFADEVRVLRAGRLVAAGSPAEVLTPGRVVEVFGARVQWLDGADGPVLAPRLG